SIYETGPAWATWQFPIERLCEMLIPLVNSHVHSYKNLINKLTIWTRFVHLQYNDKYHQQIFKPIFNKSFNKEKLFSLSKEHIMAKGEIQKIKQYYATEFDLLLKNIIINTTKIYKYSKLKTKSGSIIGSLFSNNDEDIKRNNYSIAAKFLVDKNAHHPKAPIVFEKQEFYSQVLYYFTHEYVNKIHLLAYIHWVKNIEISRNNIKLFRYFGEKSIININAIDHCVGFLKLEKNKYIIIDKENQIIF
ncbi:7150_t:CDS:2, partial [Gigaspora margarita]